MQLSAIAIRSNWATGVYGLSRAASWWSGSRSVTPRDRSAPNTYLERIVVRQTWTASWYDASMLGEVLFHRVCFMAPSKLRVITRYSTTGAAQLERIFTEDHLKIHRRTHTDLTRVQEEFTRTDWLLPTQPSTTSVQNSQLARMPKRKSMGILLFRPR